MITAVEPQTEVVKDKSLNVMVIYLLNRETPKQTELLFFNLLRGSGTQLNQKGSPSR